MSLAQNVTAVEVVDLEPEEPDIASLQLERRLSKKLSYDVLPLAPQAPEKLDPVGAYKVSTAKRIAQIFVGALTCMFAAGIVVGFAALKSILVEEDVYRDLCTEEELKDGVEICYMQDQK